MTVRFAVRIKKGLTQRWIHAQSNRRWQHLSTEIAQIAKEDAGSAPVIFFNASTRLQAMSQNAAYSFLTNQVLRRQGIPTIQFVCQAGMDHCVLGTHRDALHQAPPCQRCVAQSRAVFAGMPVQGFHKHENPSLKKLVAKLSLEALSTLVYQGIPLGFWAENSARWVLRRHHLADDADTCALLRSYLLSAWNIYQEFDHLCERTSPRAVVVFNGMFFPEAAVRQVCLNRGIKVITHEVGMQPFTGFFTPGEATAYPIKIDENFVLTPEMDQRLDAYLSQRFQGNFSMAGIRFWPQMKGLDQDFLEKAAHFKQIVPVFTNVIFDTSQVHANTLFPDMFTWLSEIRAFIERNPDTLFVIRAHPDEHRPNKESRESVRDWVKNSGIDQLSNVIFVDSREFISSYDLIQRSHFVMVYNSTIGLEAALLGKVVLAAGKARFTQLATAYLPASVEAYDQKLAELLKNETNEPPSEFQINARRFLYYQLYRSSLPFGDWIQEDGVWPGYVMLRDVHADAFDPRQSITAQVLIAGILNDAPFEMPI